MAYRTVGPVTGAATAGGGLGAAIAQILVHYVDSLAEVETAVTVVITVALALIGGYLIPPQHRNQWENFITQDTKDDDLDFYTVELELDEIIDEQDYYLIMDSISSDA